MAALSLVIPGIALIAIVAADDIAGHSANHGAGDRAARAAARDTIAEETAADRTNGRTGITTALAIGRFRRDCREAQRKRGEGTYFCVFVSHVPYSFFPCSVPHPCCGPRLLKNVRAMAWVPTQYGRGRASSLPYRPFSAIDQLCRRSFLNRSAQHQHVGPQPKLNFADLSLHGELLAAARDDVRSAGRRLEIGTRRSAQGPTLSV